MPKTGRNKYPLVGCVQWFVGYWKNKAIITDKSILKQKERLLKLQADAQELKNAQIKGELIPASKTVETWGRIVSAAKQQFLAFPDRCAQMLETTESIEERRELIDAEIKTILNSLADDNK